MIESVTRLFQNVVAAKSQKTATSCAIVLGISIEFADERPSNWLGARDVI